MFFVGFAIVIVCYALVYSGAQTLRAGQDGTPTGILECLSPSFDARARERAIVGGTGGAESGQVSSAGLAPLIGPR